MKNDSFEVSNLHAKLNALMHKVTQIEEKVMADDVVEPAAKKLRGDKNVPGAQSLEVRAAYARRAARQLLSPDRVINPHLYVLACYIAQSQTT